MRDKQSCGSTRPRPARRDPRPTSKTPRLAPTTQPTGTRPRNPRNPRTRHDTRAPNRTRPLPGPALHRPVGAHRADHGHSRGLRGHRRAGENPCPSTDPAHHTRRATTTRSRLDRADRGRDQTPIYTGHPQTPARSPPPALDLVATTPSSPRPMVPPPNPTPPPKPDNMTRSKCGCPTSVFVSRHSAHGRQRGAGRTSC